MRANSLLTVVSLLILGAPMQIWAAEPRKIELDEQMQAVVDRVARSRPMSREQFNGIVELGEVARQKVSKREVEPLIVLQALYYSAQAQSGHRFGDGFPAGARGMLRLMGIPIVRQVNMLAPYLDSSDEKLKLVARRWMFDDMRREGVEPLLSEVHLALLSYVDLVAARERRRDDPPASVVDYLFTAPTPVFHYYLSSSFNRPGEGEKKRELYWAEHVIHDVIWKIHFRFLKPGDIEAARAELDKLSQVDQWWVKRYVFEMMRREKELRDEKILERLRKDANPLVSEEAKKPLPSDEEEEPTTEEIK